MLWLCPIRYLLDNIHINFIDLLNLHRFGHEFYTLVLRLKFVLVVLIQATMKEAKVLVWKVDSAPLDRVYSLSTVNSAAVATTFSIRISNWRIWISFNTELQSMQFYIHLVIYWGGSYFLFNAIGSCINSSPKEFTVTPGLTVKDYHGVDVLLWICIHNDIHQQLYISIFSMQPKTVIFWPKCVCHIRSMSVRIA